MAGPSGIGHVLVRCERANPRIHSSQGNATRQIRMGNRRRMAQAAFLSLATKRSSSLISAVRIVMPLMAARALKARCKALGSQTWKSC